MRLVEAGPGRALVRASQGTRARHDRAGQRPETCHQLYDQERSDLTADNADEEKVVTLYVDEHVS